MIDEFVKECLHSDLRDVRATMLRKLERPSQGVTHRAFIAWSLLIVRVR